MHESTKLGRAFAAISDNRFLPQWCIELIKPAVVTVTTPDGRVHRFRPKIEDGCAFFSPPDLVTMVYEGDSPSILSMRDLAG